MSCRAAAHAALWGANGSIRKDTEQYGERRSLAHMLSIRGAALWRAYGSIRRIRRKSMPTAYAVGSRCGAAGSCCRRPTAYASAATLSHRDGGFPPGGREYTAQCSPRTALPPQAAPYRSVSSVFIRTCRSDNRCPPNDHRQTQYKPAMSKLPQLYLIATGGAKRRVTGVFARHGGVRGGFPHRAAAHALADRQRQVRRRSIPSRQALGLSCRAGCLVYFVATGCT